ncbi:peptidoglycan-binding protein [Micromonospora antibiotica]|uniref:Peptidoglycan-binding protein n=1 Tax=Micromonospora antibiotica TaxID=2807623 RepID=A0ABS3V367_9ACTN|nr:peptidoglycan-binding protein [Micromonospora antibiotica]MBO4160054.1 peptidoglycan-binding protein [Micromonospora antibiotica]
MPTEQSPAQSPPRRTGRRLVVPAVLILAVAVVGGGVAWSVHRGPGTPSGDPPVPVQTTTVVRTDLATTVSLTGTLGYGRAEPVKGGRSGTVTWLPAAGATVTRGKQLYRIDDRPVPLFYGGLPLYRDLAEPGTVGRDVRIIATNLKALGYEIGYQPVPGEKVVRPAKAGPTTPASGQNSTSGQQKSTSGPGATATGQERAGSEPGQPASAQAASGQGASGQEAAGQGAAAPTPAAGGTAATPARVVVRKGEGVLTGSLMRAIKRWQQDVELPVTGRIAVGDVVVLPGAVRVDAVTALRGDDAETPLLTVTPTAKVITVQATVTEAGTVHRGDRVTVTLPGDKTVDGTVSAVGTTVAQDDAAGPTSEPRRAVTVTVDEDLTGTDAADVRVDLVGETRPDVLAVPVGALVALSEGGYALQRADDDRFVAVATGMFAKGMVEVSGDGITEDLKVVTTS